MWPFTRFPPVGGQSAQRFGEALGTPHGCSPNTRSATGQATQHCPTAPNPSTWSSGDTAIPHTGEICGSPLFLQSRWRTTIHSSAQGTVFKAWQGCPISIDLPQVTHRYFSIKNYSVKCYPLSLALTPSLFVHRIAEKQLVIFVK